MKKIFALALLLTLPLFGGCWRLSGEVLIWQPCSRDFIYTHRAATTPNQNDLFTVKPDYDTGFRLGLGYFACDRFINLSYTYFEDRETNFVTGSNLRIEVPNASINFTFAQGRRHIETQNVDLLIGRSICPHLHIIGGARWVYLREMERQLARQTPPSNPTILEQRAKLSGVAFEAGLHAQQCLPWGFDLSAQLLGLVGIGDQTNTWAVLAGAGAGISAYGGRIPSSFQCFPAVDFEISLSHDFDVALACIELEVGYEIQHYVNALRYVNPISADAYLISRFDVGFQGPYVRLAVLF